MDDPETSYKDIEVEVGSQRKIKCNSGDKPFEFIYPSSSSATEYNDHLDFESFKHSDGGLYTCRYVEKNVYFLIKYV